MSPVLLVLKSAAQSASTYTVVLVDQHKVPFGLRLSITMSVCVKVVVLSLPQSSVAVAVQVRSTE